MQHSVFQEESVPGNIKYVRKIPTLRNDLSYPQVSEAIEFFKDKLGDFVPPTKIVSPDTHNINHKNMLLFKRGLMVLNSTLFREMHFLMKY